MFCNVSEYGFRARAVSFLPRMRGRKLPRRQHHRAAFAEADARIPFPRTKAAEDDLVAVLDETALLAARHFDRLAPAGGELKETAPAFLLRAGNGAGAE